MPGQRRFPYERIAAWYAAGDSIAAISAHFGCSKSTVQLAVRSTSGEMRSPGGPAVFDLGVIAACYRDSDLTIRQVAARCGCGTTTVERALRKERVPVDRSRGRRSGPGRTFDWDEARRMFNAGTSKSDIARHFGVTPRTIGCAVNGTTKERQDCVDCGRSIDPASVRCNSCNAAAQVKRDEQGRLYCARCNTWKEEGEFPKDARKKARGTRCRCRSCETADRRRRRHANPEATRAYERERRRKHVTAGRP